MWTFLVGEFAKLRKATVSFFMSGYQSIRPPAWKNSALTGWIFRKFDIGGFFENLEKIQVSLKSDKNAGYFK